MILTTLSVRVIHFLFGNTLPDNPEALIGLMADSSNKDAGVAMKAHAKLLEMKEKALPALVKHYHEDDRTAASTFQGRYSISGEADVGYVCYNIIARIVGFETGKHAAFSPVWPSDLNKWYQQRKDWSLAEIQAEISHCRIKHIEETHVDFIWTMDEETTKLRLHELRRKIKTIGESGVRHNYAWQEPAKLKREQLLRIAQTYLSNKACHWQDHTEHDVFYEPLIDSWVVRFRKELSPDKQHYYQLSIDDTTSSIEFKEWDN